MIAFDLQCANGHTFEGWFEDSNAYEAQKKRGLIACPVCKAPLEYRRTAEELVCRAERLAYPVRDGIPVLLASEARQMELTELDERP